MINADLAFKLLQIANVHPLSTEDIVDRAKAFAAFIENRGGDPVAANEVPAEIPSTQANEPGVRKRRTRAEIAADTHEAAVEANLLPGAKVAVGNALAAAKAVTYDDLAEAMRALVTAKGRDAGMEVLKQFGLKKDDTARALQPEQWGECVELLKAALTEGNLA